MIDEFVKWSNIRNCLMWKIIEFSKFNNLEIFFFSLPFKKSKFYNLMKLLNISVVQIIYKKLKNSIMKLSNNSFFVILIFAIFKFPNIDRFKFWPPPRVPEILGYSTEKIEITRPDPKKSVTRTPLNFINFHCNKIFTKNYSLQITVTNYIIYMK